MKAGTADCRTPRSSPKDPSSYVLDDSSVAFTPSFEIDIPTPVPPAKFGTVVFRNAEGVIHRCLPVKITGDGIEIPWEEEEEEEEENKSLRSEFILDHGPSDPAEPFECGLMGSESPEFVPYGGAGAENGRLGNFAFDEDPLGSGSLETILVENPLDSDPFESVAFEEDSFGSGSNDSMALQSNPLDRSLFGRSDEPRA
jgi:hypothetical protein